MALVATTGRVPKDAIPLTRSEAVDYQWQQIQNWPDKSEVWPFQWGIAALATLAGAAGSHINRMYRRKLKLRNYGYVTSTFPMILAPAMFSAGMHIQLVTHDLFLQETKCPLCLQYRAAFAQVAMSTIYPMVMSPIANFLFATRHSTYRVPYVTDVGPILRLWWQFTKPMSYTLIATAFVQCVAASVLTYYEADVLYKIRMKLMEPRKPAIKNSSVATE